MAKGMHHKIMTIQRAAFCVINCIKKTREIGPIKNIVLVLFTSLNFTGYVTPAR